MLAWLLATAPDEGLRDPRGAVEHAQIGVDLAPGKGEAWRNLGVARYRAGDWRGAVEALDKAASLGTADDGLFFLAMAEARLGDREKAEAAFAKGVRWHEAHKGDRELPRFRAEAEAALAEGQ